MTCIIKLKVNKCCCTSKYCFSITPLKSRILRFYRHNINSLNVPDSLFSLAPLLVEKAASNLFPFCFKSLQVDFTDFSLADSLCVYFAATNKWGRELLHLCLCGLVFQWIQRDVQLFVHSGERHRCRTQTDDEDERESALILYGLLLTMCPQAQ